MANWHTSQAKTVNQGDHLVYRFQQRICVKNLRADMTTHTFQHQILAPTCPRVHRLHLADVNSELVLAHSGRDVRVRGYIHVRIDTKSDTRLRSKLAGDSINQFEFAF